MSLEGLAGEIARAADSLAYEVERLVSALNVVPDDQASNAAGIERGVEASLDRALSSIEDAGRELIAATMDARFLAPE